MLLGLDGGLVKNACVDEREEMQIKICRDTMRSGRRIDNIMDLLHEPAQLK
jgi:hypothetical protein